MSVETNLRAAMAEAVAPTHPDTDQLVSSARRRGMGIRRRRQALGTFGVAAALGLAVLAPSVVAGDHGRHATDAMQVGTTAVAFDAQDTRPVTGRSAAAALLYAVGLTAQGNGTDFRSAVDNPRANGPYVESYTLFRFTPAGSDTSGEVAVNVQPNFAGDPNDPKPGDHTTLADAQCQSWMQRCTFTRLDDGSKLTTYDDTSSHGSAGIRRVAALYRPDGVRVVASASNGFDVTELDEKIARDEPVLTTDQLVAIVGQPWWGAELPAYFSNEGEKLSPYSDRSAPANVTPTAGEPSSRG
ncbi:hypothetical protein ACVW00_003976 [Marmoricola sp. URHA0025 HA25]